LSAWSLVLGAAQSNPTHIACYHCATSLCDGGHFRACRKGAHALFCRFSAPPLTCHLPGCCTGSGGARGAQGGSGAPGARRRQLHGDRGPLRGALAAGAPRRSTVPARAAGDATVAGAHALSGRMRRPWGGWPRCARASPVRLSSRWHMICRLQRVCSRRQEIQEYVARATDGASASDPFEVGRRPCTLAAVPIVQPHHQLQAACAAKHAASRLAAHCKVREVACRSRA